MSARWLAAALACLLAVPAAAEPTCPTAKLPPIALPHLRKALSDGRELTIVALGSSSTEGSHATDLGHSYPAILQAELSAALPQTQVAVLNRGVGGQDAAEELARLHKDALAAAPVLVIWQVGANGAMHGSDPELFKHMVESGVRQVAQAGADVILMDNQRSPAVLAAPMHSRIDQALADVAKSDGVRLFARGRLMDLWQDAGHPYAEFLADDGIHMNDRGYSCIAKALATAMLDGLGPEPIGLHAAR